MTIMTTTATQSVKTAEASKTPTKDSAQTAQSGSQHKPEAKAAQPESKPAPTPPAAKAEPVAEKLPFDAEKFAAYKTVRMYLLQEGTIQYDPAFPELVLNTSDKRGQLLPLTPFFKSRIGVTLDIVLD